ncbi:integrase [Cryobacterium sp. TMT1-3]|nr:integrase [Cryobacterium sp. TMT1-3]
MPRRRMRAGEVGTIRLVVLANGQIQAHARMRDEFGTLHRLKGTRATEVEARRALDDQAELLRNGMTGLSLTAYSTIAEAAMVFLDDKRRSGTVEISTIETYEFSVNNVIIPECGDLLLTDLTVLRCNRILQHIRETKSLSAARKARSMFSQICATGIEHGVLAFNPVRDARALPLSPKKESALTPGQLEIVRALMRSWRSGGDHFGPRPNARLLENAMWIMVGTSARIGEVLALRRCDVDVTANPPTLLIAGTITQTRAEGLRRKPSPKRSRQKRRIALPSFAATAIRRQLSEASRDKEAYLFATKTGEPRSVSNVERLLRTFVADNETALEVAGIEVREFSTHIFRRTAATLIESVAGITLASRLLGHSNEQVTRASYVVSAELVDPITAQIMDDALGSLL